MSETNQKYIEELKDSEGLNMNNIPAFPSKIPQPHLGNDCFSYFTGMTLRDYFAIHAPCPSREDINFYYQDIEKYGMQETLEAHAQLRYKYADAMLKQREVNK